MARYCIGNGSTVINVVGGTTPPDALPGQDVFLDPTGSTNVNAIYDPKDVRYDKLDVVILTMIFQIVKGTVPGGMPQPGLTAAQFKNYVKNQMT